MQADLDRVVLRTGLEGAIAHTAELARRMAARDLGVAADDIARVEAAIRHQRPRRVAGEVAQRPEGLVAPKELGRSVEYAITAPLASSGSARWGGGW